MGEHLAERPSTAFWSRAYRSPLRWPVMLMLLISALAHVPVIAPGLRETAYVGVLFIVLILADIVLLLGLAWRDSSAVWVLTALTCGLAVLAYVLSRTVGLPGMTAEIGAWVSTPGLASLGSEAIGFVLAVLVLARRR